MPSNTNMAANITEADLQRQIVQLLRRYGIEVLWSRTDKRTRNINPGWPDLTFCVAGTPCAWEVKLPGKKPRKDQSHQYTLHSKLAMNGWRVSIITSVDDANNILGAYVHTAPLRS